MTQVHLVVGVLAISLNAAAGLYGAWCWWRVRTSVWFWRILRAGQAVVILQVLLGGVLVILGHKPSGLHVLYGVLPLLISLIAEQLRIGAAQIVLDSRGFESAAAVGSLPEEEQRVVMLSIIQREVGVMALAAIINVVLLARAAGTA
jgi:heme A synthase